MAKTIEQRVVEFKFNNSDFEKNVSQSMGTLDNLNKKIKDSTSGDAFKELGKAANGLSFDGVTSTITKVTEKFSVMEQIAIGALRNIGASIEEHLVSGLKKVTTDNIVAGFQRYGQKTESVATIMAAIANEDYGDVDKLDYVEELLEKLAWFSDETSYNFTDMTDNISKFTAAGLDLDVSTTAMMGIANWAANAGQNAQVASRAMYQLSQAMGMGSIQLVDWKSIEIANMATKEVKELMLEYGVLLGELQKYDDGVYFKAGLDLSEFDDLSEVLITANNFRQHLTEEKWLTTDVFAAAMGEYASYSEALHNIINDAANEDLDLYATDLMKKINKALKKAEKTGLSLDDILMQDYGITATFTDDNGNLRSYLEDVTELGIRAMESAQKARTFQQAMDSIQDASSTKWSFVFEKIFGNMEEATELWTYLSEVLYNVFAEPLNGLNDLLKVWKEFEGRDALFGYNDEDGEFVNGAFQNILTALVGDGEDILGYLDGIKAGFSDVFNPDELDTKELGEAFAEATKNFRDFTEGLIPTEEKLEKVKQAVITIISPLKSLGGVIGSIIGSGKSFVSGFLDTFSKVFDYTKIDTDKIGKIFELKKWKLDDVQFEATDFVTSIKVIESPIKTMSKLFTNLGDIISRFFDALRPSEEALSKLQKALEGAKVIIDALFYPIRLLNEKLEELLDPDSTKIEKVAEFFGGPFLEVILWLPSKIGEVIVSLDKMLKKFNVFEKIGDILSSAWKAVKEFVGGFVKAANLDFKWMDKVKEFFSDLFDFVTKINGSNIFNTISDGFNSIKSWLTNTDFSASGEKAFKSISSAIKDFGDSFSNITGINFETLGSDIANFADRIWEALKKIGEAIKGLFTSSDGSIFSSLGDSLKSIFKIDTSKFGGFDLSKLFPEGKTGRKKNIAGQAADIFKRGDALGFKVGDVEKSISDAESLIIGLDDFASALSGMDSSGMAVVKAMDDVSSDMESVSGGITEVEESGVNIITKAVSALASAISFIGEVFVRLFDIAATIIDFVGNGIVYVFNQITGIFDKDEAKTVGDVIIGVIDFVANTLETALPIISKIIQFITEISAGGISVIVDAVAFIIGKVGEIKDSAAFGKIVDVIKSIFESILGGADTFAESDVVKNLIGKITDVIENIVDTFIKLAPKLALLMAAKGLMSFGTGVKWLGDGIESIGKGFKRIGSAAKKYGRAAEMNAIASILDSIAVAVLGISASFVMLKSAGFEKFDDMKGYLLAIGGLIGEVFLSIGLIMGLAAKKGRAQSAGANALGVFSSSIVDFGTSASSLATIPLIIASVAALMLTVSKAVADLAKATEGMEVGQVILLVGTIGALIGEVLLGVGNIVKQAKTPKGLKGVKGLLLGMATFFSVITASISKMGNMDSGKLAVGIGAVEIILLTITKLVEDLAALSNVKTGTMLASTLTLAAIGALLLVVMNAIKGIMESIPSDNEGSMLAGMGSIFVIGVVIAGIIAAMGYLLDQISGMNLDVSKLATVTITLGVISLAIGIMAQALIGVMNAMNGAGTQEIVTRSGEFDVKKASAGSGPIGAMLAIVGGVYLLGKTLSELAKDSNGWDLMGAAAAMVVLAYAVSIVADVISGFADIASNNLTGLIVGIGAFVVVLAAMIVAAKAIDKANLGKGFLVFSASLLVFGAALVVISKGIENFVDVIIKLGDKVNEGKESISKGIKAISEVIVGSIGVISEAVAAVILAVARAFIEQKLVMIEAFLEFLDGLLEKLVEYGPKIIPKLLDLLTQLTEALFEYLKVTFFPGLFDLLSSITPQLFDFLGLLWKELIDWLIEAINEIGNLVKGILTVLGEIWDEILIWIVGRSESLLKAVHDLIVGEDGTGGVIGAVADLAGDLIVAGGNIIASIVEGIGSVPTAIVDAFKKVLVGEDGEGGIIGAVKDAAIKLVQAGADLITDFVKEIQSKTDEVKQAFINLFKGYTDEETGKEVRGILDGIGEMIDEMLQAFARLLNDLADAIRKGVPEITQAAINLSDAIVSQIPIVGDIYDLGKDAAGSLAKGVADVLGLYPDEVETAVDKFCATMRVSMMDGSYTKLGEDVGWELVNGILTGLEEGDPEADEAMRLLSQGLVDEAKNVLGIQSPSKVFKQIGAFLVDGLKKGIDEKNTEPEKSLSSIASKLAEAFKNKYGDVERNGADITRRLASGMLLSIYSVENSAKQIMLRIGTVLSGSKSSIERYGSNISTILSNGIKGNFRSPESAGKSFVTYVSSGINSSVALIINIGKNITNNIAKGISNNAWMVENASKNLAIKIKNALNSTDYSSCGSNVASGVAVGISNSAWVVEEKAKKMASNVKNTMNNVLKIHSPSKVMMETGKFVDLGLAKGIDKYADDPINSTEDMANLLVLAMTNAMQMAAAALEDENYSPVISPVIDLAEIQNGMHEMDNLLYSNRGYSLNAAMNSRYDPYENYDGSLRPDPTSDLIGSVGGITGKLDEMIDKLSKLKLYLDSGALVGGITNQMDVALGRKALYAGRGSM